ncbi:MAG: hypothetical protein V4726_25305 [Verrucomicrobiota bacterium]
MTAKEKLLAKFRREPSLTKAGLPKGKEAQAALRELLAEGLVIKIGTRYFSDTQAPTKEREMARLEARLLSAVRLFKENKLHASPRTRLPTTRAALDELVDQRVVLRLEIDRDKKSGVLYLHSAHAGTGHPSSSAASPSREKTLLSSDQDQPVPVQPLEASAAAAVTTFSSPPVDPGPGIRSAHAGLARRHGTESVFISELAAEAGLPVEELQRWLQKHAVELGQGTLDEGDWSCATEEQRAAAMMLRDRRRLYIRLHS